MFHIITKHKIVLNFLPLMQSSYLDVFGINMPTTKPV